MLAVALAVLVVLVTVVLISIGGPGGIGAGPTATPSQATVSPTSSPTSAGLSPTPAASAPTVTPAPPAVLLGAGDIASCASKGDEATAALLDTLEGTVFTLGDNVYDNGTSAEYRNCYGPSWGRPSIKDRTKPVPGNHEYNTPRRDAATTATSGLPPATRRRATTSTTRARGGCTC